MGKRVLIYPNWKSRYITQFAKNLEDNGIQCFYVSYIGAFLTLSRNVLKHKDLDHVIVHWTTSLLASDETDPIRYSLKQLLLRIDLFLLKKVLGKNLIWIIHNDVSHDAVNEKRELKARTWFASKCDVMFAHGTRAAKIIEVKYGLENDSVQSIWHGNFLDCYKNEISKEDARNKLELNNDLVFLSFGNILPYKGIIEFAETFSKLNRNDCTLIVAGNCKDASLRKRLELLDSKNVHLHLKYIEDDDAQIYFNAADLVVLPYLKILTSGALAMAQAFDKPVIAPNIGSLADYLSVENGILYKAEDEDDLLEILNGITKAGLKSLEKGAGESARKLNWHYALKNLVEYIKTSNAK